MKTKNIITLLQIEAIICIALAVFSILNTSIISSIFAFPFEQIAFVLRWLSLKGSVLNIVALGLYVLISSLPILYLWARVSKPYKEKELLLLLCSLLIFAGLYFMINPQLIGKILHPMLAADTNSLILAKTVLGGVVYSGFTAYIVLSLIDKTDKKSDKLQSYMFWTLVALCLILVFEVFGLNLQTSLKNIQNISSMAISEDSRVFSYLFTSLNYITLSIPILLSVNIILKVIDVGRNYFEGNEENTMLSSAIKLGEASKKNLQISVLSSLGFNILQLPFASLLVNSSYSFVLPILSIILLFATLIFAKIIEENHTLKQDNESII